MTFFKPTFLSKYWIRSSQIAGFCPNNTKIFLDRYFSGQWNFEGASCSKILLAQIRASQKKF